MKPTLRRNMHGQGVFNSMTVHQACELDQWMAMSSNWSSLALKRAALCSAIDLRCIQNLVEIYKKPTTNNAIFTNFPTRFSTYTQ